jgi:hypothetical protein
LFIDVTFQINREMGYTNHDVKNKKEEREKKRFQSISLKRS